MGASALLAVGVGAALGAWLRWGLAAALNHLLPSLPLGTLVANLTGAFLIGVAFEFIAHHATLPMEYRLFFVTGFLGSLTTFSTFSFEAVELLQGGRYGPALLLIAAHLLGSLAMTFAGFAAVRAASL